MIVQPPPANEVSILVTMFDNLAHFETDNGSSS